MLEYKYRKGNVEGSTWKRAASILIYNDFGEVPRVAFGEQLVIEAAGEVLSKDVGTLDILVDEDVAAETFNVLGPEGEPTGEEVSIAQLANLLMSAYVHFAEKRDREYAEYLEKGHVEEEVRGPAEIYTRVPGGFSDSKPEIE